MAKKVVGFVKLQIPAGQATMAPPVGPALGQRGVNGIRPQAGCRAGAGVVDSPLDIP